MMALTTQTNTGSSTYHSKLVIKNCHEPQQPAASSFQLQQLVDDYQIAVEAFSYVHANLCSAVHDNQIFCKLEHEFEVDTTSFYIGDSHQRSVSCIVFRGGTASLPCDSLDTDSVESDTELHALEDQAFFSAEELVVP